MENMKNRTNKIKPLIDKLKTNVNSLNKEKCNNKRPV